MQQDGPSGPSGSGMSPNVAAAISYVLGFITGIVFLMIEKDQFVRFHAYQSIIFSVAWAIFWVAFTVLSGIIGLIPVINVIWAILAVLLSVVISIGGFVLWVVLIIKAAQGQRWKMPYIGDMAEGYASK